MTANQLKVGSLFLVLLVTLVVITGCGSNTTDLSAKVMSVTGKAEIRPTAIASFADAKVNDILPCGGILKTGEESLVNLEITGKGVVDIKSDSMFELESGKDYVVQSAGMAVYKIDKNKEGFKVKSPQGVTCVLGTRFMVRVFDNTTVVGVEEGKVSFTSNKGETRILVAKQKITADNNGFSSEPTAFDMKTDSFNYIKLDGKWVPKQ